MQDLKQKGIEVLLDDRDASAGSKFADADLIGIPHRVVISEKSLEKGGLEYKKRNRI
jgi:prolyl-tRNA synthetase